MWMCPKCGEWSLVPCETDNYEGVYCTVCHYTEWSRKI